MKYKSLRFFIAVNSIIGWAVVGVGGLVTLTFAFGALANRSPAGFLGSLVIGASLSAIAGMFVFALNFP